nr:hypothetical protein [Tanacetum cinerariifolium]
RKVSESQPHHTPFPEANTSHPATSSIPLPSIPTAPISPVTQPDPTSIRQYTRRARIAQSSALLTAQEEEIVRLKEKVQVLEDREGVAATHFGDDAPIKGRSINEGEAVAERIRNDSEDWFHSHCWSPATIISTGSEVGPTASPIVKRRKGKEVMVESNTPKKKKLQEHIDAQVARELEEQQEKENMRMNEQIARDEKVSRIHTEEEIQGMIDSLDRSNETTSKYLQEYQEFALELPLEKRIELIRWKVKDFKGMTFEEIKAKFAKVWKQVEDFIPMGSKEEAERLKRKGLNLKQEHVKKQKTSEKAPEVEKSTEDITEEKMKEMMQLVPVEDVYVQSLQVKHPIIVWKVHTEGQRSNWQIIRLGGSYACYQFFVDLLKKLDKEDLNQLWVLVKEYLSIRPATNKEIFMLVEKDYPLGKGLALVTISYKLQVENYSQMAEDLIRKIYNIANTPRQQGD